MKDIGIICVESGYDIHFAGAAGLHDQRHRAARPRRHRGGGDRVRRARSRSSIASRAAISSASRSGSSASGWKPSAPRSWTTDEGRRALLDRFENSQRVRAERSVGRARRRPGAARVHAARRPHACRRPRNERRCDSPWFDVGPIDSIPAARLRASCARRAARSRSSAPASDEVFALENRCPHKGGPLSDGIVHGRKVACPLHNWIINLERRRGDRRGQGLRPKLSGQARERPDLSRHERRGGAVTHRPTPNTNQKELSNGLSRTFRIRHQDGRRRRIQDLHVDPRHGDPRLHGRRDPGAGGGFAVTITRADRRSRSSAPSCSRSASACSTCSASTC